MQRAGESGIARPRRSQPESRKKLITYGLSRAAKMAFRRLETTELDEVLEVAGKSDKEMQAAARELQSRYRLTMMNNAQLDNEKQALLYQVDDLQDQLDSREVEKTRLESETRTWNKSIEDERRQQLALDEEIKRLREMLSDRDDVIRESGYRVVSSEVREQPLLSADSLDALSLNHKNSACLNEKLEKLLLENTTLNKKIKEATRDLETAREDNYHSARFTRRPRSPTMLDIAKLEREQCQRIVDCKRDVNNAHLKIDSLENKLIRLEAQIHRYREVYEESDREQTRVKAENRRTSKQLEELRKRADELSGETAQLERRLEKVKDARRNASVPRIK